MSCLEEGPINSAYVYTHLEINKRHTYPISPPGHNKYRHKRKDKDDNNGSIRRLSPSTIPFLPI
jgi:hypothetical protein